MPKKEAQKTRKRKGKDLDEIHEDLQPAKAKKLLNADLDLDLPGFGQFYCIQCARHFTCDHDLTRHRSSKIHKQRLKALSEIPYTQRDADAAGGLGS